MKVKKKHVRDEGVEHNIYILVRRACPFIFVTQAESCLDIWFIRPLPDKLRYFSQLFSIRKIFRNYVFRNYSHGLILNKCFDWLTPSRTNVFTHF